MDAFVILALVGIALLVAELLLPTGGILATLGALGLIVGGVIALTAESESSVSDWAGPALITLGVLSIGSFYFITRKVLAAHRDEPIRTGTEEMLGSQVEARSRLDPEGQVWAGGAIWRARLVPGAAPAQAGDRVTIEAVEGLTLVVRPLAAAEPVEEGAG